MYHESARTKMNTLVVQMCAPSAATVKDWPAEGS